MAAEIHPGNQRKWTLLYTKEDGSPGLIDTETPADITMSPADFCHVEPGVFDPATGKQVFAVSHNGSVASGSVTITNDGDLGAGTVAISAAEEFNCLAPGGATSVQSSVGDEEPTPQVNPLPSQRKK